MARRAQANQVSREIIEAMAKELAEIQRQHDDDVFEGDGDDRKKIASKGDFVYPLLERCRVYDRALKLEALKLKAEDPDWGSAYKDKGKAREDG